MKKVTDGDTCHSSGSLPEVQCACVWTTSATAARPDLTGL